MTRDETILRERLKGDTLHAIGGRHGLSHEGVRYVVARETRRMIDEIHLDLLTSHATGEAPSFVIPEHGGEDFDLAMEYVQFVTRELAERGMRVRVEYRPTYNGVVLALVDAEPPANSAMNRSTR
jgi:hypothetical protein